MIKFSEISECAYVFCGDELLQKEDILDRLEEYRGGEFFTANEREVGFVTSDASGNVKRCLCAERLESFIDVTNLKRNSNEYL